MTREARVAKFADAIERAYSMKPPEGVRDQIDFESWYPTFAKQEFDTATQIVQGTKDLETLQALATRYLVAFLEHADNRFVTHFSRSEQLFFDLFERCKKLSTRKNDLFGDWAGLLENQLQTPMKLRFQELSQTYRSKILALIPKREAPPKRLLDYLREEFVKQHQYSPKLSDLYALDPAKDDKLVAALPAHLDAVRGRFAAAMQGNRDIQRSLLHAALKAYRRYLEGFDKSRLLPLLQVIKNLQVQIRGTAGGYPVLEEKREPDRSFPTVEMYSMACMQLLRLAQGKLLIRANRDGFTSDEADYLLEPLKGRYDSYYSNIDDRFRRRMASVEDKFALSTVFLDLMLLTNNQLERYELVPLAKALELQRIWHGYGSYLEKLARAKSAQEVIAICSDREFIELAKEVGKRRAYEIPIGTADADAMGHAFAHVGSSPGSHALFGKITIIDMVPSSSTFYVELEHLRPHLFSVGLGYMTDKVAGSRIGNIAKSLELASMVLGLVLQAAGYITAVISGGFAGLVYEAVSSQVFDKVEQVATEIHPIFGKLVGLGTQFIGSPSFGKKVVDPNFSNVKLPPVTRNFPRPDLSNAGVSGFTRADRGLPNKADAIANVSERLGTKLATSAKPTPSLEATPSLKTTPSLKSAPSVRATLSTKTTPSVKALPAAKRAADNWQPSGQRQQGLQPVGQRLRPPVDAHSTIQRSARPSANREIAMQQQMAKRHTPREKFEAPPPRQPKPLKPGSKELKADQAAQAAARAEVVTFRRGRETLLRAGVNDDFIPGVPSQPIATRTGPGTLNIVGDAVDYNESLRAGYQLYIYRNAQGQVLYAGISGQATRSDHVLQPGTRESRFPHWGDRLRDDHAETVWIQDAVRVEVYPLSQAQMILAEQAQISANRGRGHNFNEADNDAAREISIEGVVSDDILRYVQPYVFRLVAIVRP